MRGGGSDQDLPPPQPPISSPPLEAPCRRVRSMRTHLPPRGEDLRPTGTTGQEAKSAVSRFSWWCSGLGTSIEEARNGGQRTEASSPTGQRVCGEHTVP